MNVMSSYNSFVPELEASRLKARRWAIHYNSYFPPEADTFGKLLTERAALLKNLLGSMPEGADDQPCIEPPFTMDYGCNIKVGKGFYANFNISIIDSALVTIGDRVMCGPNVAILAATHETDVRSRRDNIEYAKAITIGDDCWIGGNAVILPGVTVGNGCTIAAGAIVTKDVPSWSVVMGQPARVVKKVEPVEYTEK